MSKQWKLWMVFQDSSQLSLRSRQTFHAHLYEISSEPHKEQNKIPFDVVKSMPFLSVATHKSWTEKQGLKNQ